MARKKKRLEKKVTIGGRRVSVYGYTAYEIQEKIEALEKAEERKQHPLFQTILDEWQDKHFSEIAIGTQVCYSPAIKRAELEFKDMRICDITPGDISALLQQLAYLGYSQQTVKVQKIVLKLIFRYAQQEGYVATNPAEIVDVPKRLPKERREPPTEDELKIVSHSADKTFGVFALFLMMTGCRRGEALAVKWGDIDFENNTISINKNVVFANNKAVVNDHTKTKSGMRKIVLPEALRKELLKIRSEDDFFVFGNGETPYTNTQFRKRWDKYLKETGLNITPHQLRHAYATMLFDAGIDEKVTQNLMGHSRIEITRDIYTHIRQQKINLAENNINNFINGKFIS